MIINTGTWARLTFNMVCALIHVPLEGIPHRWWKGGAGLDIGIPHVGEEVIHCWEVSHDTSTTSAIDECVKVHLNQSKPRFY